MTLEEWRQSGIYLAYRERAVFLRHEGEGDALVCIHGYPTASWDWHRLWPYLTRHFRVVALDMMGFGFSDKPGDYDYSIFDQASLHESILESLGIEQVHLLAHDYGDTVAQELLARQLEGANRLELRSICFLNGGLIPGSHRPRRIQKLLGTPLGAVISRLATESRFRSSFSAVFSPDSRPGEEELKDFWRLVTHNGGRRIQHRLIRYLREREEYCERWVGALRRPSVPLRLVCGADDPVSGTEVAERYCQIVPRADAVLIEETGHYPQLEAPGAVLQALTDFWKKSL